MTERERATAKKNKKVSFRDRLSKLGLPLPIVQGLTMTHTRQEIGMAHAVYIRTGILNNRIYHAKQVRTR